MKTPIKDFLANNLTYQQFKQLPQALGVSDKKVTRLINGTDQWSANDIQALVDHMNTKFECSPEKLLRICSIPNNITLDEMTSLNDWWEELEKANKPKDKEE